jgi:rod shape-determining protein MreD
VTYYVGVPLVFLTALAEASVLPMFQVQGLQPSLTLVVLVAWLMVRGEGEALVLVPFAGLFLGLAGSAPLGTALLALAPMAILNEVRGARLGEGQLLVAVIFTVVLTVLYHLIHLLVFALQGDAGNLLGGVARVILPVCLLNVLLLLPIYGLLLLFGQGHRRSVYA